MDTSFSKRVTPNTTGSDNHHNHEDSLHRPSKVHKIANSITGFSSNILNIPELIGPTPSFSTHSSNTQNHTASYNEYLRQQERNNQENQRTPHHTITQHIANHQQNVSPNSAEDTFYWYQEDHIQEGIQNCQKSLIGKLLSEKIVTKQIIQNTLLGIWGDPQGFQLSEVEGGFFNIIMDREKDIQRALKGNP
jgi:hypothetical protein